MAGSIITQEQLKELLHYDQDTGIFTWKVTTTGKIKVGNVAGGINKQGYIRLSINKIEYKAHRLVWLYMTGEMPKEFIDHINGLKTDNRWCNLREATNTENNRNTGLLPTNTSGYKGISLNKKTNRWIAQASIGNKNKYLGSFGTPEEAANAYKEYVKLIHGEFLHTSLAN